MRGEGDGPGSVDGGQLLGYGGGSGPDRARRALTKDHEDRAPGAEMQRNCGAAMGNISGISMETSNNGPKRKDLGSGCFI